jgi:hypothetical protein
MNRNLLSIKLNRDKLVRDVKEYCKNQVDLWRQVPILCARANGNPTNLRLYLASNKGLLPIYNLHNFGAEGYGQEVFDTFVDLESGQLVNRTFFEELNELYSQGNQKEMSENFEYKRHIARDDKVIGITNYPSLVNAQKVIDELRGISDQEVCDGILNWREERVAQLDLKEIYERL